MGFFKPRRIVNIALLFLLLNITLFSFGKKDDIQEKEPIDPSHEPSIILPAESHRDADIIAGGYQLIALDSEYALKAAEEARAVWSGEAKDWEAARLVMAESQVVAGQNIRLTYENLPGVKGAVVFFPLDGGTPTVTWLE